MKANLEKQVASVISRFPKLKIQKKNGYEILAGQIDVTSPEVGLLESFDIELYITKGFPFRYPKVKEVGGKIPRNENNHINGDETLCICVEPEEILICKKGITLPWFIEQKLIPHLASQALHLLGEPYPKGEYLHNNDGIIEWYEKLIGTSNQTVIKAAIQAGINGMKKNSACFCGSGNRLKFCHFENYQTLRELGQVHLTKHLKILDAHES